MTLHPLLPNIRINSETMFQQKDDTLTLITVICTIFCAQNISCVKYFLCPVFTLPHGLVERTSVYKRRGCVFKALSKQVYSSKFGKSHPHLVDFNCTTY